MYLINLVIIFVLVSAICLVMSCIVFSMKMISFAHTIYDLHKVVEYIKKRDKNSNA